MIGTLGPVATIAPGVSVLGEALSAIELAGAALVLLGVGFVARARSR